MKKILALTAFVLCLVACKKEGKGYTVEDLGSTAWKAQIVKDTESESSNYQCTIQLWEDGKADLIQSYSPKLVLDSKAIILMIDNLSGTWTLSKGKLKVMLDKQEEGNVTDLPWNLTGTFLDTPSSDEQRMTMSIPGRGSVIFTRSKLTK